MKPPACTCGWKKPVFAFCRPDGSPIDGAILVKVLCPECGEGYVAGERSVEEVIDAVRAQLHDR